MAVKRAAVLFVGALLVAGCSSGTSSTDGATMRLAIQNDYPEVARAVIASSEQLAEAMLRSGHPVLVEPGTRGAVGANAGDEEPTTLVLVVGVLLHGTLRIRLTADDLRGGDLKLVLSGDCATLAPVDEWPALMRPPSNTELEALEAVLARCEQAAGALGLPWSRAVSVGQNLEPDGFLCIVALEDGRIARVFMPASDEPSLQGIDESDGS